MQSICLTTSNMRGHIMLILGRGLSHKMQTVFAMWISSGNPFRSESQIGSKGAVIAMP